MKYKIGDKFLVEITEINNSCYPYVLDDIGAMASEETLDKLRTPDDMTAEEAWGIAKKLFADFSESELDEIFGRKWSYPKLMELSPQEAKAKIEEWEAKKQRSAAGELRMLIGERLEEIRTRISAMRQMPRMEDNTMDQVIQTRKIRQMEDQAAWLESVLYGKKDGAGQTGEADQV